MPAHGSMPSRGSEANAVPDHRPVFPTDDIEWVSLV
jgi:hypothetical protein